MIENHGGDLKQFAPIYGKPSLETDTGAPILVLQSFQQLTHGPLRAIRGYTNLLTFQEIAVNKALRELQDANNELAFFHLESSNVYQSKRHSVPDEPFEIRALVDQAICFATRALIRPSVDILYRYKDTKKHYRSANKAAVKSLLYNFILHRVAHMALDDESFNSATRLLTFDINNTSNGISIRQCPSFEIKSDSTTAPAMQNGLEISDQLTTLLKITGAQINQSTLEIPLRLSGRLKHIELSNLRAKVISRNSTRQTAIAGRLEDLGIKIEDEEENADCFFIDAEHQVPSQRQIDQWSASGIVFLFNYSQPSGNMNGKPLQYPIKHDELLFELDLARQHSTRVEAKTVNVMVVDDNPQNLRLVVTHLESLGIRTTSATHGVEAITLFGEHIDLVFMDLHMPDMNGFEASIALRNSTHPNVPIIAFSADLSPNDTSESLRCGINDLHKKPINRAIIEQLLIQYVGYKPKLTGTNDAKKPALSNPQADALSIVDIELSLIRADHRPALATEMLAMMIESLPVDLKQLNNHFEDQDYPAMGLVAHRIKGACCYCGAPKFEDSIRKMHILLKNKVVREAEEGNKIEQDKDINGMMLVVNRDARRLIEWHLSHRNPFFNRVDGTKNVSYAIDSPSSTENA